MPAKVYPTGWFTQPVFAWFGPDWKPSSVWGRDESAISAAAARGRDTALARGYTGTVAGLSTKSDQSASLYFKSAAQIRELLMVRG